MKYKSGFEFTLNGAEAMVWGGQQGPSGWVYIVVVGWSKLHVMTEQEIDFCLVVVLTVGCDLCGAEVEPDECLCRSCKGK
jgi:hypothetical protein